MPRPPRAFHAGIYHLGSHGSDQRHLFLSDQERAAFLGRLGLVLKRFELGLVAYTLMGNHYHLLLRVPDARVSKALQNEDLLSTCRYLAWNPVAAGLATLSSGHGAAWPPRPGSSRRR